MTVVEQAKPGLVASDTGSRKRRRPSGEPPPLPKHLYSSGKYWLALALVGLFSTVGISFISSAEIRINGYEVGMLQDIASLRTAWLTRVAQGLHFLGSDWVTLGVRWAAIVVLVFFKRFRHLFVFLAAILMVGLINEIVANVVTRVRPIQVDILGHWQGASHPSRPLAALAVTLIGIAYSLVVPGKPRSMVKWGIGAILLLVVAARLYLAVEYPTDVFAGVVVGVTVPLVMFRLLAPNDIFPVSYKRRKGAHLDVEGERGEAIRRAVEAQLGIAIIDVEPFGLGGSAGSTPLRITVGGEPPAQLFAKLYAKTHLRSDRWYKIGRTLLYGRLEDEGSFSTVRRLVQYEDYMLRVMRDARLPTPTPYGFVEITPEREYMLVTDFVVGAKELLDAEVNDSVIDQCMRLVRELWDAGIAHRDVKPSNILVARGTVHLIDVAFGEVRPSPWRQAVDLANMMLVLALRSDAARVYGSALKYFDADEIAEAFAATHGVTIPSQTRALMKKHDSDLVAEFRALAPNRKPIAIQRWSYRRVGLTIGAAIAAFFVFGMTVSNFRGAGLLPPEIDGLAAYSGLLVEPDCRLSNQMLLMAQSVPSAALVPCVETQPVGWSFGGLDVVDGRSRFFLDSDRAGFHAVTVDFTRTCDISGATEVPTDEPDTRRFERVKLTQSQYAGTRYYVFDGGCAAYRFNFTGDGRTALADEVSFALSFEKRIVLNDDLRQENGLTL